VVKGVGRGGAGGGEASLTHSPPLPFLLHALPLSVTDLNPGPLCWVQTDRDVPHLFYLRLNLLPTLGRISFTHPPDHLTPDSAPGLVCVCVCERGERDDNQSPEPFQVLAVV